jgi:LysM repeat protein
MKFLGSFFVCFISITALAQDRLVVMGSGANFYINRVSSGSIPLKSFAIQYDVPVAVLAQYNAFSVNATIEKGDLIKIPLTKNNFVQKSRAGKFQPVYYIFKSGDNLSRISQRYNKINIDTLKKWNDLNEDYVPEGKPLTIGFLINEKVLFTTAAYQAIAYDTIPNPNELDAAKYGAKIIVGEMKPIPVPVPEPPAEKPVIINPGIESAITVNKKMQQKNIIEVAAKNQTVGFYNYKPKPTDEGYFAHSYFTQEKNLAYQFLTGDAGVFKTISGVVDRKFYVLVNEILPGTILRITTSNKKSVCAKVLGPLPETKGAEGLLLRMNNAAAKALDISEDRLTISISYIEF